MKGKIQITIDGRLKFSHKYNSSPERIETMGRYNLMYQGRQIEYIISPHIPGNWLLTDIEVARIKEERENMPVSVLAKKYMVSENSIWRALNDTYCIYQTQKAVAI